MSSWIAVLLLQVTPLQPLENPGDWVTDEDYPKAALNTDTQGIVGFRLAVDAAGQVSTCTVTESSGSAELDAATCQLLTTRAKFKPARDATGKSIAATYSNRVTWRIPNSPMPLSLPAGRSVRRTTIMEVDIDPEGLAQGCRVIVNEANVPSANLCSEALPGTRVGPSMPADQAVRGKLRKIMTLEWSYEEPPTAPGTAVSPPPR